MKKLIVFGFAVVAAVAANAAAFAWSANNIQKVDGNSSVGLTAYLVDASKVSRATMLTALAAGDYQYMTAANYLITTPTIAQGTAGLSRINTTTGDATAASYDAYTIILDGAVGSANYFLATAEMHATKPDLGNVAFTFGTQASTAWTAISGSTPPVPEPTSGLLMIVGLGALALRRRRA